MFSEKKLKVLLKTIRDKRINLTPYSESEAMYCLLALREILAEVTQCEDKKIVELSNDIVRLQNFSVPIIQKLEKRAENLRASIKKKYPELEDESNFEKLAETDSFFKTKLNAVTTIEDKIKSMKQEIVDLKNKHYEVIIKNIGLDFNYYDYENNTYMTKYQMAKASGYLTNMLNKPYIGSHQVKFTAEEMAEFAKKDIELEQAFTKMMNNVDIDKLTDEEMTKMAAFFKELTPEQIEELEKWKDEKGELFIRNKLLRLRQRLEDHESKLGIKLELPFDV